MRMGMNRSVAASVRGWVADWPDEPDHETLERTLRHLARWRSILLANTFLTRQGDTIHGGLFAGMTYSHDAAEGALIPRLLGTYESELVPHFRSLIAERPGCVIDVGCAEGYYAVGLARLMPGVSVYAFDIDPNARAACKALAATNDVASNVIVDSEFLPERFESFAGRRALVVVDIEGAELDLLRPDLAPALAGMALIVETHAPRILATLVERFSPTHEIVRVDHELKSFSPPDWLAELSHLDLMLAVWEWRRHPTPWLVMRPKAGWR